MKDLFLVGLLIVVSPISQAAQSLNALSQMPASALALVDASGETILSQRANKALVPASTVKLITALMALEQWGAEYRFKTDFYFDEFNKTLIVKGFGDPILISEELDVIVNRIKQIGITQLNRIITDTSYFTRAVNITEQGKTNNPYDAAASALALNFNTIEVDVSNNGIASAEQQTPLTPMALTLANGLPMGKHRINLGAASRSPQYFVQVLTAKLAQVGVLVSEQHEEIPYLTQDAKLLFTHANSKTLQETIMAMLEFSNNFIASQIFLLLGIEYYGAPADLQKSQQAIARYINEEFNWSDYVIKDGAGLSRANQLTVNQLIEVLERFRPYRALLPQQTPHILAKSGTLKGVSCYAGYLYRDNEWQSFAVMINQPVRYRFREQLAHELLNYRE